MVSQWVDWLYAVICHSSWELRVCLGDWPRDELPCFICRDSQLFNKSHCLLIFCHSLAAWFLNKRYIDTFLGTFIAQAYHKYVTRWLVYLIMSHKHRHSTSLFFHLSSHKLLSPPAIARLSSPAACCVCAADKSSYQLTVSQNWQMSSFGPSESKLMLVRAVACAVTELSIHY